MLKNKYKTLNHKELKLLTLTACSIFIVCIVSVSQLHAQKAKWANYADLLIVDVRTPKEYKHGSVQGAVNIPIGTIKSRLSEFKDKKQVIVYCHSGIRAMFAKGILQRNGIKKVINGGTKSSVEKKLKKYSDKV